MNTPPPPGVSGTSGVLNNGALWIVLERVLWGLVLHVEHHPTQSANHTCTPPPPPALHTHPLSYHCDPVFPHFLGPWSLWF